MNWKIHPYTFYKTSFVTILVIQMGGKRETAQYVFGVHYCIKLCNPWKIKLLKIQLDGKFKTSSYFI